MKACCQCGRELVREMFQTRQGFERARFCNWSCFTAAKPAQLQANCVGCGMAFLAKANRVKKAEAKYCSHRCYASHLHARVEAERATVGRLCPACDVVKPITEFRRHKAGVAPYCRPCFNARQRRIQALHLEPDWAEVRARVRAVMTLSASGCWEIQSAKRYSQLGARGAVWLGHRLSYRAFKGVIPTGLQLDHLCMNKRCVNPEHLEPVTPLENTRRYLAHVRQRTSQSSQLS